MNYYERHLGDYARDTGHLSVLEHGVYNLLLDRYYITESAIPDVQVYRLARAKTTAEKKAVDAVLTDFFELIDGAWHNHRADSEIEKAKSRIKAAQENGKAGGRPSKPKPDEASNKPEPIPEQTKEEPKQNPEGTQQKPKENPEESLPITNHQAPGKKDKPNGLSKKPRETALPVDFQPSANVLAWYDKKGFGEPIAIHLESFITKCKAKGYRYIDWDAAFMNAISDDWAKARSSPRAPTGLTVAPASKAEALNARNRAASERVLQKLGVLNAAE